MSADDANIIGANGAGSANSAKFLVSIEGFKSSNFTVTRFTGRDAISAPYGFDIDLLMSESAPPSTNVPTANTVLGKSCRFELIRDGSNEITAYSGVIKGFCVHRRAKPVYSIRLVPGMELLSLNTNNRVFQKLTVIEIIKKVVQDADIEKYCGFRYECVSDYQPISFCVQYQETDLNFISRLMERNGIWYYFENADESSGKENVVVTDSFSKFPAGAIKVPFVENIGFAETSKRLEESSDEYVYSNNFGESVYSLSSKSVIIPKIVKLRAQNYRTPDSSPEGICEVGEGSGAWGSVYEYGGAFKNSEEARRQAEFYLKRLQVENMRTDGKSRCNALRAGRIIAIDPNIGDFLLTSVEHDGGIGDDETNYVYKYNNTFCCVDSIANIYAPPLRAAMPQALGLMTARVEALGEDHPSLDEMGRYRIRMPFDNSDTEAYGSSKDIRLSQPLGGSADGESYGIHFPSKMGAEMILSYVDGDPDKPIGLGFVPNGDAQSVVNSQNKDENVIRTWGGNVLKMIDVPNKEEISLETHNMFSFVTEALDALMGDDVKLAYKVADKLGLKGQAKKIYKKIVGESKNGALVLKNQTMTALLRIWKNEIELKCDVLDSYIRLKTRAENKIVMSDTLQKITVTTTNGCTIEMDNASDLITVKNANKSNEIILDGKRRGITMNSKGDIKINADGEISISGKKSININASEKINIGAKGDMIINSEKMCAIKGKGRMNVTTSQSGAGLLVQSKKGDTVIKGKSIRLN